MEWITIKGESRTIYHQVTRNATASKKYHMQPLLGTSLSVHTASLDPTPVNIFLSGWGLKGTLTLGIRTTNLESLLLLAQIGHLGDTLL